ncbi:PAS domain S-box protein [Deltaproteobacteria bacterium TL4]
MNFRNRTKTLKHHSVLIDLLLIFMVFAIFGMMFLDVHEIHFPVIQNYFITWIAIVCLIYGLRGLWSKRYFYAPLTTFLKTIEKDPMSEVSLSSPYQEWNKLEEIYNNSIKQLKHFTKMNEELNAYLQEIMDTSPDAIFIHNLDGDIVDANKTSLRKFGYSKEELLSLHMGKLTDAPNAREKVQQKISLASQGELCEFEWTALKKNGETFPVVTRLRTMQLEAQSFLLAMVTDVTARKHAEEELKKTLAFTDTIIRELSVGITIHDKQGQCILANETAANQIGITKEQVLQRNFYHVNAWKKYGFLEKAEQAITENKPQLLVAKVKTTSEKIVFFNCDFIPFSVSGQNYLMLITSDITENKKVEEELRKHRDSLEELVLERTQRLEKQREELFKAKEAAESANRAKSFFLANMSHEIRTPMNAILGFSEILEKRVTDEQQKEYLQAIRASGKSLLTLINDILDLSKVETGKLELKYLAVDPHAIFLEMKQIFSHKIHEKGLDFQIVISPSVPQSLFLDEIRLRQVLLNLIGNAVKFTEKGSIKLSVHAHYTRENRRKLNLIFSVEDTGIGIPEDQLEIIFDSFQQAKDQDHAQFGGTGLGLAITKRLVEMMHGHIFATSELGVTTSFNVILEEVEVASAIADEEPQRQERDRDRIQLDEAKELIQSLEPEIRKKLPELISLLDLETCQWEALGEALKIRDVQKFATRIQDLGVTYHYPPLTKWGETLHAQACKFDIENLPRTLNYFPQFITTLRSLIN